MGGLPRKRVIFSALALVLFTDLVLSRLFPGGQAFWGDPFLALLLSLVLISGQPLPHWSLGVGLLQDAFVTTEFGLHGFSKVFIALGAAALSGLLLVEGWMGLILLGFFGWLAQALVFYCYHGLAGIPLPHLEWTYLLLGGLSTGLQGAFWHKVLSRTERRS